MYVAGLSVLMLLRQRLRIYRASLLSLVCVEDSLRAVRGNDVDLYAFLTMDDIVSPSKSRA